MGTVPSGACRVHQQNNICTESELIASNNCPAWAVEDRVRLVRTRPIDHISGGVGDRQWEFSYDVRQGLTCFTCVGGAVQQQENAGALAEGLPVWDMDNNTWLNLPSNLPSSVNDMINTPASPPPGVMPGTGMSGFGAPEFNQPPAATATPTPEENLIPEPTPTPTPWPGLASDPDDNFTFPDLPEDDAPSNSPFLMP